MRNIKGRRLVFLSAVYLLLVGPATNAEQTQAESLVPSQIVSAPARTHNTPGAYHTAATRDAFAHKIHATPTAQSPNHTVNPTTMVMVAGMDASSKPTVNSYIRSLEFPIPTANTGLRHDDNRPSGTGGMTLVTDRAINNEGQTAGNSTDSGRFPYAIMIVLLALLGMVSVARRHTL
ncbi:MAG: hypothetical protein ABFS45_24370 [Pseudomonadota bacterium]